MEETSIDPESTATTEPTAEEEEVAATNVNKTLDQLAVTALDLMNDIIRNKKYLEDVIKEGALHLAKARYILGSHSVSVTQLPLASEDTEPFSALCSVKVDYHTENNIEIPRFTSIRETPKGKGSDPLHWFGVLVPQNLRLAQTQFRSATDIVVDIASLQARLTAMFTEYPHLKSISTEEE